MQNTQSPENPNFQTPDPDKNKKTNAESLIEEGILDPSLAQSETNTDKHDPDRANEPNSQVINTHISSS